MENQTPFLFEDLDIRISKISSSDEEIKSSKEENNISSGSDPKTEITKQDYINSQSKLLADNNALDDDKDLQTEKRKLRKVGHMNIGGKFIKAFDKTKLGKFQCTECDAQFKQYCSIRQHYVSEHTDTVFSCTDCPYTTKRSNRLNYHFKLRHLNNDRKDIKRGDEEKNISSCDWESSRNSSKKNSTANTVTEISPQDHIDSQSNFLADNNAINEDASSLKLFIKSNVDHTDLQTEKGKQKKVGYRKIDGKVRKVFNITQIGKFQCAECEKQFTVYNSIRIHYITEHTNTVYSCSQCPFKSKSYGGLNYHLKLRHTNSDPRDFILDDNSSPQMVERIKSQLDSNLQFQCTACGKPYTTVSAVKIHYNREHINKTYDCNQCPYIAKDKGGLKEHRKITHSKKEYEEYKCDYCDQVFEHVLHLRAVKHARSSHDNLCHKCDKAFIYSHQLRKHINKNHPELNHQGPKVYTKTKDGKYSCIICNKQFGKNRNANKHFRKKHLNIVYDCNHCKYSTKDKYILKDHIKYKHSENAITCEYCQLAFQTEYQQKEHLTKAHNFQCGKCDSAFVRNDQLQLHINISHEGKEASHHCKICNKMVLHLKQHNDNLHRKIEMDTKKGIQCLKCKVEFKTKTSLKKHKCMKPIIRYY